MMTKEKAEKIATDLGLDPARVYFCVCCQNWAHEDDPCDCAYGECPGACRTFRGAEA